MPETTAQRSAAARKGAATRRRHAAETKRAAETKHTAETKQHPQADAAVGRTTELSEEVLKSLESGQRAAIEAVRKFVDTVDEALPALGERPSRREEVVDAAMEMADRLVHTQYEFLRKVVESAGKALGKADDVK